MDPPRASQSSDATSGQPDCETSSHSAVCSVSRTSPSGSAHSGTGRGEVRASPCGDDYLLLQGKTTQPMSLHACLERKTRWVRMHLGDVRRKRRGQKNQFGGSEWLKLRTEPASQYAEWIQSQTFSRAGCSDQRANVWRNDEQVWLRLFTLNEMTPPMTRKNFRRDGYRRYLLSRHNAQWNLSTVNIPFVRLR